MQTEPTYSAKPSVSCPAPVAKRVRMAYLDVPLPRWSVASHTEMPTAPHPMCFTPEALQTLLGSVGARPPETGAKGWSATGAFGFDLIEYDTAGSASASGAVYAPDVDWGAARVKHHLHHPGIPRAWSGDLHSHPGNAGRPSPECGPGLGDLGYVRQVFAMNEWMQWFLLPILTGTGTGHVTLHPWMCERGDDNRPRLYTAELVVCAASRFPARAVNPEWERRNARPAESPPPELDGAAEAMPPRPFDLERFTALWREAGGGSVEAREDDLVLIFAQFALQVRLPERYPLDPPELIAAVGRGASHPPMPFSWRDLGPHTPDAERRLMRLCIDWARYCNQQITY